MKIKIREHVDELKRLNFEEDPRIKEILVTRNPDDDLRNIFSLKRLLFFYTDIKYRLPNLSVIESNANISSKFKDLDNLISVGELVINDYPEDLPNLVTSGNIFLHNYKMAFPNLTIINGNIFNIENYKHDLPNLIQAGRSRSTQNFDISKYLGRLPNLSVVEGLGFKVESYPHNLNNLISVQGYLDLTGYRGKINNLTHVGSTIYIDEGNQLIQELENKGFKIETELRKKHMQPVTSPFGLQSWSVFQTPRPSEMRFAQLKTNGPIGK